MAVPSWLGWLGSRQKTDNTPVLIRKFSTANPTLSRDGVSVDGDGWLIDAPEEQVVRLFEVADPGVEQGRLTYRAALKCEGLTGRAFLEMWCRLPGRGEFFSKGLHQVLTGTTEWASYEVPFRLKKGQRPDLIKLNLAVEGRGKVWIKDIELFAAQK